MKCFFKDVRTIIKISIIIVIISLSGCRQAPPIPKEGDVVIWKYSPELIIKAKLGQRREHVIKDSRTDHLFYEPEYERFIGQFSIDYQPVSFPKFTKEEQTAFEAEYGSKVHAVKSIHPIEFNLMLNDVMAKATDVSPYGERGVDDPNQVKVFLTGTRSFPRPTKTDTRPTPYNTREYFELELMKRLDIKSKTTKYGLDCYRLIDGEGKRCFGHSINPLVSGFYFYISPYLTLSGNRMVISVTSHENIYGEIRIVWFTDQRNIKRIREVDAAIWRLLEAWNISHLQKNN